MSISLKRRGYRGNALSRPPNRERGFTLIELMTVVVVVAVLLALAVPSYSVLSMRTKLKSYANELVASVYLARGEAIKRNAPMTLCISNADGDACVASGDWDQGWIVINQAGDVIKWQQQLPSGIKVFELSSVNRMNFQPSGVLSTAATMTVCQNLPSVGIEEREVTFSITGRQRVETILKDDPAFTDCSP